MYRPLPVPPGYNRYKNQYEYMKHRITISKNTESVIPKELMSFSGSMNKPGMHLARRTLVPVFVKTVKIDAPEYISVQPTPFWP